jgi:hypothetical protein
MTEEELAQIEARGVVMGLKLIALVLVASLAVVWGDQIIVTFYVLDATRVLPFWQVLATLGLVGLVLAYRPS